MQASPVDEFTEDLSTRDVVWQADDSLWSSDSREDIVESSSSDPWYTEDSQLTSSIDWADSELPDDDFSRLSAEQCTSLIYDSKAPPYRNGCSSKAPDRSGFPLDNLVDSMNSHSLSSPDRSMSSFKFEVDHSYLNKLEKRLDRLYKLSGKAEKNSMIKQVSDRASAVFMGDTARQDSSADTTIAVNPVSKALFPHQQAITAEEKIVLVKSDHLAKQSDEVTGEVISERSSKGSSEADRATCQVSASTPPSLASPGNEGVGD